MWRRRGHNRGRSRKYCQSCADQTRSHDTGELPCERSRRGAAQSSPLTTAEQTFRQARTTAEIGRSGAAYLAVWIRTPRWGKHRTQSGRRARRASYASPSIPASCKPAKIRVPGVSHEGTGGAENGFVLNHPQALPLIFAHHQRTPTNRNRQSLKNSGGLPSKAWPMNCRIHPITKSPRA
jgi:hypothetical protein